MATPTQQTIYRGDTPTLRFTVKDSVAGTAFDISSYTTINFYAKKQGASDVIDRTCTITDGPGGKCEVTLTTTDTSVVGTYDAELEIRKTGVVITVDQFTLIIAQDRRTAA